MKLISLLLRQSTRCCYHGNIRIPSAIRCASSTSFSRLSSSNSGTNGEDCVSKIYHRICHSDGPINSAKLNEAISTEPEKNVRVFVKLMKSLSQKNRDLEDLLVGMAETAPGLNSIMDMREECSRMIRRLPEPELIVFDKVLLGALCRAVTPLSTTITTVSKDSPVELIQLVRRSDRVHPILNDIELYNRLSDNRSVFILTHILLPGRPLVVLHVAHSTGMFQCVSDIKEGCDSSQIDTLCRNAITQESLEQRTESLYDDEGYMLSCLDFSSGDRDVQHVNTFYSISSLEVALRGIPVGGWCISKAKEALQAPSTLYTTLSPMPGFREWLNVSIKRSSPRVLAIAGEHLPAISTLASSSSSSVPDSIKVTVTRLAAYYLLREKQRGCVLDPVGHFHVTNGAVVWALRWAGTRSQEMQAQSLGLMVNYLYDSAAPHRAELYSSDDKIVVSGRAVLSLLE